MPIHVKFQHGSQLIWITVERNRCMELNCSLWC